jgi:hypothetical protein
MQLVSPYVLRLDVTSPIDSMVSTTQVASPNVLRFDAKRLTSPSFGGMNNVDRKCGFLMIQWGDSDITSFVDLDNVVCKCGCITVHASRWLIRPSAASKTQEVRVCNDSFRIR